MQNNGTTRAAIALIGAGLVMAGIAVGAYSEKVELTKKFNVELDKAVDDVKRTYRDTYFKEAAKAADRMVEEKMTHISSLIEVLQKEGYTVTANDATVKSDDEEPEVEAKTPKDSAVASLDAINAEHKGTPQLISAEDALNGPFSLERIKWYTERHIFVNEYDEVIKPQDAYDGVYSMFQPWVLNAFDTGLYEQANHIYVSNDRDMTVYDIIKIESVYDPEEDESDVS